MKYLLILLSISATGTYCFAEGKDPRPEMHVLAQEIANMEKFLISDVTFTAKENDETIKNSLDKISAHVKKLEEGTFAQDPALKVNLKLLSGHINDATQFFKEGNKSYSRYMVQSSLSMCIACHTRGKTDDFALPEPDLKNVSDLDKAEYYSATRQFEKAKKIYEDLVDKYPANKIGPYQLRKALLAQAVFYARIKDNPKAGAKYFGDLDTKNFPIYIQKEIKAWASDFKLWSAEKESKKALGEVELIAKVKKILKSDDFSLMGESDRTFHIRRLRASALLHKVLEAPGEKSPNKGEALLLLGQIYHRVAYQMFFRFGEMYLKTCIQDYKKTKLAKDCYAALEQAVTEGYTGSAGTSIPEDEEVELMQLKRLAF